MDIYFGTVIRSAPIHQGGGLHRLDWDRKQIMDTIPIFPENPTLSHDPHPRGNGRGCRGVQVVGETVLAADYHTIRMFDLQLHARGSVSHGLMVGLHEIAVSGPNRIWVTSTNLDAALEFDWQSGRLLREFWPREMPVFQQALNLEPKLLDKAADQRTALLAEDPFKHHSHLHLNAVAVWKHDVYALLPGRGAVVNLSRGQLIVQDEALRGSHNLVIQPEAGIAFVNESLRQTIRLYDLERGRPIRSISFRSLPWMNDLAQSIAQSEEKRRQTVPEVAQAFFGRGLALSGSLIFLGISPASILCLDWQSGEFVDAFQFSTDVHACVHGLALAEQSTQVSV